ncbi:MAG: phosphohydrolase, partial [Rhodoferax sp.]|nr:phosphohydrolase [Rhodoferax sp.]
MNLVAVNLDSIRLGHPLPFALRSERGVLLAHKGYVISERSEITYWTSRGMTLCVDVDASEDHHRAYVGKLHEMVRSDRPLGELVNMQIAPSDMDRGEKREASDVPDWTALQLKAN